MLSPHESSYCLSGPSKGVTLRMAGAKGSAATPAVFVVDDDPAMRASLSLLLGSVGLPVRTYATATAFLDAYNPSRRGCLVLDVRMPGMSGLQLLQALKARGADLPVIVITGHADVPMAVRAMRIGVMDFIEKPFDENVLLARVRQALDHDRHRAAHADQAVAWYKRLERLTRRETQVLERVVAGRSTRQIAAEFGVTTQAIDAHRKRLLAKLELATVADVIRCAVKLGMELPRSAATG